MKILYFTGTGNSLYIAKTIASNNKGDILSIPQLIRNNEYQIKDDVIGLVFPTYHDNFPEIVENYLSQANLEANYFFVIISYGGSFGNVMKRTCHLLKTRGINVDYTNNILMVTNYVRTFDIITQRKIKKESEILNKLVDIQYDINERVVNNNLIFKSEYKTKEKEKTMLLLDENKCVGCNVCTLICPISNIEIKNDKVVFKNKCDNCLACLHACPHNSIHVVNQKGEEHYTNPNVSIGEIIRSNRQL